MSYQLGQVGDKTDIFDSIFEILHTFNDCKMHTFKRLLARAVFRFTVLRCIHKEWAAFRVSLHEYN